MAYVSNYEHDVFISYAHVDDERIGDATAGWVTTLLSQLRSMVNRNLGRTDACAIWHDSGISLHEGVTGQLMQAVQKTATLVVVLSPGYLVSDWCQREKDAFLKEIRRGQRPDSRVFVVELNDVDREKRPKELRDLPEYKFWVRKTPTDTARRFCEEGLVNTAPHYYQYIDTLNKLADNLATELLKLSDGTKTTRLNDVRQPAPDAPCVFVAEVTDDLCDLRDDVISYLDQSRARVLPERPYVRDEGFADSMRTDLAKCKLFVQLLSGVRGMKMPGDARGYPRLQYDIARDAGKVILQWRAEALDIGKVTDPNQRDLVQVETVRAEGIEDFKSEIRRRLFEPIPEPPKRSSGPDVRALVFVDGEANDWDLATSVKDQLRRLGVDVSLPTWDQPPDAVREDLEDNLKQCNGLIVIYGKSTVTWVRRQLLLCRKVIAQREQPLQALAVYQGPPEDKPPLNIDLFNLRLIDCTQARTDAMEAQLQQFIGQFSA